MNKGSTLAWSPGDELLRWASEVGSGPWEKLRDAAAFVCRKHDVRLRPWQLADDLSAFGHMDIDWASRQWSVAAPRLNLVPGMGLMLILTGSRPYHVDQRFEAATAGQDVFPDFVPYRWSPMTKLAKCASVETAQVVADRLGSELAIDPARDLVEVMRAVDEQPMARAAAPSMEDATRFDAEQLDWVDADGRAAPGLYRVDLHGRFVHRRLDENGFWWDIDLAAGQFLELAANAKSVIRWRPGSYDRASVVEVRERVNLPILAERAFRISSGLRPKRIEGWRRYVNVPHDLAEQAAHRLLQDLTVTWQDS